MIRKRRNQVRSFNFSIPSMFPDEGCCGGKNFGARKKCGKGRRVEWESGRVAFKEFDEDLGGFEWELCGNPHFYAQNLWRFRGVGKPIERKFSEADFGFVNKTDFCGSVAGPGDGLRDRV